MTLAEAGERAGRVAAILAVPCGICHTAAGLSCELWPWDLPAVTAAA